MLLSDRDIRAQIESGRVKLDPYSAELVQPSSVDVRLDRYFRVFENHRYPHIDPAVEQADLTRLVEAKGDEPVVHADVHRGPGHRDRARRRRAHHQPTQHGFDARSGFLVACQAIREPQGTCVASNDPRCGRARASCTQYAIQAR